MGLRISTNINALTTSRLLGQVSEEQNKSFQRIASGQRITTAADDPAGSAISSKLKAEVRSLSQAERNANDAVSMVQVAEGSLSEVSGMLVRLRELAIQAASDTIGDNERGFINVEVKSLVNEIDRTANSTVYNQTPLLNGQAKQSELEFQVGTKDSPDHRISYRPNDFDIRADTLGISGLNYESEGSARDALETIDNALTKVTSNRASLGALQSRLQTAARTTGVTKENLTVANSRVADTDLAAEASQLARNNILQQAGIAVLTQANSAPSQVLNLLKL